MRQQEQAAPQTAAPTSHHENTKYGWIGGKDMAGKDVAGKDTIRPEKDMAGNCWKRYGRQRYGGKR